MAWSDAARAAALEARRAHARTKRDYREQKPYLKIGKGGHSEYDRAYLARQLRGLRSGAFDAYPFAKSAAQYAHKEAVLSTAARNATLSVIAKGTGLKVTQVIAETRKFLKKR